MTVDNLAKLKSQFEFELKNNTDLIFLWHQTTSRKDKIKCLYSYLKKCLKEIENFNTFHRMTTCNKLSTISGISRPTIKKYLPVIMIDCINDIRKVK